MNFFFAFKNTPKQYARKIADAFISYYNGDITRGQLAKTLAIYIGVQAALFGAAGQLMRSMLYGDDDDYLDDIASSVFTSFTNAFPIFGDVNKYIVDSIIAKVTKGKKPYYLFSQPLLADLERFLKYEVPAAFDGEITIFDIIGVMATPLELTTGLPIKTIERPFKKRMKK